VLCPWDESSLSLVCFRRAAHTVRALKKPATQLADLLGCPNMGKTVRHYFSDLSRVL